MACLKIAVCYSCEAQLISVVEDIHLAMDHSHQVDVIFIDFQKAFDKVPHHRLLNKLYHYGIRGKIHEWISTWPGADLGFSERGANHNSESLKQGVWGAQPPRSYSIFCFMKYRNATYNARFRVFNSNLKVL